jgi:ubiquinone/menaquinone biosynthesis C-methylase UbiE
MGELAVPLARYFDEVLAIDPDPGMLHMGECRAAKQKITNIKWQKGSSRTLTGVSQYFKLATMGQSLHWMDEEQTLKVLYRIIEPGGGILIVGTVPAGQNRTAAAKDELIKQTVAKYLGTHRRAGKYVYKQSDKKWESDVLPNSPFGAFEKREYVAKSTQNIDQIIGNLYSMSWALRSHFGSKINEFEDELRTGLSVISKPGQFENTVQFEAFFLKKSRT